MPGGLWGRVGGLVMLAMTVAGCAGRGAGDGAEPSGEKYLAVWAGDADRKHSDFLAIINADWGSRSYGKVIRTIPVKSRGNEPHGVNGELRFDRRLFATGLLTNRVFVFDLRDPEKGTLSYVYEAKPGERTLGAPRQVATLPGGRVAVTCADQLGYTGDPREVLGAPGGLLVLGNDGKFVKEIPAVGPGSRAYVTAPGGVAIRSQANLLITTNEAHGFAGTTRGELMPGITVQTWALPNLTLGRPAVLEAGPRGEENLGPHTPRLFRGRPFALVNTHEGGALYVSDSLQTESPLFKLAFDFGAGSKPGEAAITPDDRWYVTALTGKNQVVSLDVRDPWKPRRVASVNFNRDPGADADDGGAAREGGPHALAMALDGVRIAVADYGVDVPTYALDGDRRVYMLRLDRATGGLRFDTAFRDETTDEVGVDFDRTSWPHGDTGPARPRGLLFVAPPAEED